MEHIDLITPEEEEDKLNYKEFFLEEYYLKIGYFNEKIFIIVYNIEKLDGIRYEINIKLENIYKLNDIFKSFNNIEEMYIGFLKLINENKYMIKMDENNIIFSFILTDILNNKKEINFTLKNNKIENNEYINILSNEIKKLRNNNKILNELKEENKQIKNEIIKLKNLINKKEKNISIDIFNKKFKLNIKDNNIENLNLNNNNYNNEIIEYLSKLELKQLKKLDLSNNNII